MGILSTDFFRSATDAFTEPLSSFTAVTVFGKSVRNDSCGGSHGFGVNSFWTRRVRSWLENDGARPLRPLRICFSALPPAAGFDGTLGGFGARALAVCSRESTKRNLHMFHSDLVSQRPSNNVYEQGLAQGHTSALTTLAALSS